MFMNHGKPLPYKQIPYTDLKAFEMPYDPYVGFFFVFWGEGVYSGTSTICFLTSLGLAVMWEF